MDKRSAILAKIRHSLKTNEDDESRRAAVKSRLESHPKGVIPARGQLEPDARLDLFQAMAEKYNASVERIAHLSELPEVTAAYLKARNLPAAIRIGADPRLASAPWSEQSVLELRHGASDGQDLVALSHAFAGIAETGTLCVLSGPDNPVTLNFLPDHHIVVLTKDDVVGDMESMWERLRAKQGGEMPRTVNLITGPSRSADIEQTLLLGAHGPRALHIVVVEGGRH